MTFQPHHYYSSQKGPFPKYPSNVFSWGSCKYSGNKKANLDNHYYQKKACALVKRNSKPFVCIEPGCKSAFKREPSAKRHSKKKGHKYARTENSNNEQRMEQN